MTFECISSVGYSVKYTILNRQMEFVLSSIFFKHEDVRICENECLCCGNYKNFAIIICIA